MFLFICLSIFLFVYQSEKSNELKKVDVDGGVRLIKGFAIQDIKTGEIYASKDAVFIKDGDD